MVDPGAIGAETQRAILNLGPIIIDGLSVNLASWSVAGSAMVLLAVFLGRIAAQSLRTRRQDRAIIALVEAQLRMFEARYREWPATSAYLRAKWHENDQFAPFSTRTTSLDRPYDRHRDRLPLIMPLDTYRVLISFYEEDRHFDDARAAVLTPAFLAITTDRRALWFNDLDRMALDQQARCEVLLREITGLDTGPVARLRSWFLSRSTAGDTRTAAAERSNDG